VHFYNKNPKRKRKQAIEPYRSWPTNLDVQWQSLEGVLAGHVGGRGVAGESWSMRCSLEGCGQREGRGRRQVLEEMVVGGR
jgi:hypothetical protein